MTGGDCFGPFELVRRLGIGATAEVWQARVRIGGREVVVALKRVLPDLTGDARVAALLREEARLAMRLVHRNIAAVIEVGEIDGRLYLACEHVDGCDLGALLGACARAGEPVPLGLGPWVARELCAALACAHAAVDDEGAALGLVHRDVKPANVLLGRDGAVKLADFGVAKALAERAAPATTGVRKGTRAYMAPEQAAGEAIDHRADLYAVGVVLYQTLTGRLPATPLEPPSRLNHVVPPALDEVCARALAPERERRFGNAAAMGAALAEVARELGWDAARLGAFVRARLPAPAPTPIEPTRTLPSAPRAERGRLAWIATATLALAAALAFCLWPRATPSAPTAPLAASPSPLPPPSRAPTPLPPRAPTPPPVATTPAAHATPAVRARRHAASAATAPASEYMPDPFAR